MMPTVSVGVELTSIRCQYYWHSYAGASVCVTLRRAVACRGDHRRAASSDGVGDAGELTIDELAARTGMTVRTVRFYATQGLLPPPTAPRPGRLLRQLAPDAAGLIRTSAGARLHAGRHPAGARRGSPTTRRRPSTRCSRRCSRRGCRTQSEQLDRADLERRVGPRVTDDELGYLVAGRRADRTERRTSTRRRRRCSGTPWS